MLNEKKTSYYASTALTRESTVVRITFTLFNWFLPKIVGKGDPKPKESFETGLDRVSFAGDSPKKVELGVGRRRS